MGKRWGGRWRRGAWGRDGGVGGGEVHGEEMGG